jgi:hypothetical protein
MTNVTYELMPARVAMKGCYGKDMRFGRTKWNQWKATIWTAHTVTVNSLTESINQSIDPELPNAHLTAFGRL